MEISMSMRMSGLAGSVAFAAAFGFMVGDATAQSIDNEHEFGGLYVGGVVEHKNIIAGAQVGGVDMLAQESRLGIGLIGGWRHQFSNGLVIGVEGGWGAEDATLDLAVPASGLNIEYDNGAYWRLGASIGFVVGPEDRTLLYAYVHETTRDFDVTIRQAGNTFRQQDEQGLLAYGVGIERRLTARTSVRGELGTSRAEFDGPTNVDPDQPIDVSLGLLFRL
jgi:hypothetical protein